MYSKKKGSFIDKNDKTEPLSATKTSQTMQVSSSLYHCKNIIQAKTCNPLSGGLPFSRYIFKSKKIKSQDFGGAGLYACFFRDRLIYVGKYLGTKKDFRSGNIISVRWVKHIGTFTMMARNISFRKKGIDQINQALKSQTDIIPKPILDAFPEISLKMITRERDCVSTYARFDVAVRIWRELGYPALEWLNEFSFLYTKIEITLPCAEVRQFISRAENNVISRLRPPGNSIKNSSWGMYSIDEVSEVFNESLSYSYENASRNTSFQKKDLLKMEICEPEEESNYTKFEEQIDRAPRFAEKFIRRVKQEFNSIDDSSIEYTNRPDMRIRKIVNHGLGFINAATIRWQSIKKRFLIATALSEDEIKLFGISVDIHVQTDPLPSVIYLDETIINKKMIDILRCLKYSHRNRKHKGHN